MIGVKRLGSCFDINRLGKDAVYVFFGIGKPGNITTRIPGTV
jgi:hypothetical protein